MHGVKGIVFDIQRYSIHDGPGIRTVVFLKGCPLRCLWCANPESQKESPQLVHYSNRCIGCQMCVDSCPTAAIKQGKEGWLLDRDACNYCGHCVDVCYAGAWVIMGQVMSVDEVVEQVLKDKDFYQQSGGGVTLSGGEPCFQWEFAREILKCCKDKGIATAIETSGYTLWANLKEILTYTDTVLFDIKHVDSEQHKRFTGVSNGEILKNLSRIVSIKKLVVIRVPVIPGFNDSLENFQGLIQLLTSLSYKPEVHLLPYHQLGVSKYKLLGYDYKLAKTKPPSRERMEELKRYVERAGYKVKIGG